MFNKVISSLPFMGEDANEYLSHITGDSVIFGEQHDNTMIATIRALLASRLKGDESFRFTYKNRGYASDTIASNTVSTVLKAMCGDKSYLSTRNTLWLHEFCLYEDADIAANMALVKGNFAKTFKGWKRDDKISSFFMGKIEILCYINTETHSVYLFTTKLSPRLYHYLQCSLPAMMPWFFSENPLDETELELMHSLTESTEEKYLSLLNAMVAKYDFRTLRIRKLLHGFEKREIESRISAVKNEIQRHNNKVDEYNRYIREQLAERENKLILLAGLETKICSEDEDSELMKYFIANKKVTIHHISSNRIDFYVKDYLDYFDDDEAKAYINNSRSYIYNDYGSHISREDMKKLMTAIFIDKKLRIRVAAKFSYRLAVELDPKKYADFSGEEFSTYTPNPHIDSYHCLGNSRPIINESLAAGDSMMVIEQCIAATKNLNFRDGTVGNSFMSTLYENCNHGYNTRCIELPDGNVVKPSEAIAYLRAQEEVK